MKPQIALVLIVGVFVGGEVYTWIDEPAGAMSCAGFPLSHTCAGGFNPQPTSPGLAVVALNLAVWLFAARAGAGLVRRFRRTRPTRDCG